MFLMNVVYFITFIKLKRMIKIIKDTSKLRVVTQNMFPVILDDINLALKGIRHRRGHLPINLIPAKKDYCIM